MDRLPSMVFGALWNNAIIKEIVRKEYRDAGYAGVKITPTPLHTRIVVTVNNPRKAVAKNKKVIEILKSYGIENPIIEIQKNKDPTNAQAIASMLAVFIEHYTSYAEKRKRLRRLKYFLQEQGIRGAEIIIKGRHARGIDKKMKERHVWGQIKKVGECVKELVDEGYAEAIPKMGMTSIRVRLIPKDVRFPDELEIIEKKEEEKGEENESKVQETHRRAKRNVKRRANKPTE